MKAMNRTIIQSPVGRLLLASRDGMLCQVRPAQDGERADQSDPVLDEAKRQLAQYFAGERRSFHLPLQANGSEFDRAVWRLLEEIPFGEIRTYGQLAAALGKPKASRAVGGACSRNPLLIVVPCHRVIAGSGRLTGFAAGLEMKRALLVHEGQQVCGERIQIK